MGPRSKPQACPVEDEVAALRREERRPHGRESGGSCPQIGVGGGSDSGSGSGSGGSVGGSCSASAASTASSRLHNPDHDVARKDGSLHRLVPTRLGPTRLMHHEPVRAHVERVRIRREPRLFDSPADDRGVRQELRNERGRRPRHELLRRAELLDAPAVEHRHAVGEGKRLRTVVRDVHDRQPELPRERVQLEAEAVAERLVERGERLVEQQHPRPADKRASDRDPLPLPAGERRRVALRVARQPDHLECLFDATDALRLRNPSPAQRVVDVASDVPVRPHGVLLEHHAQLPSLRRDASPLPRDDSLADAHPASGGRLEARDRAQERRLAGAGRADKREELTVAQREVNAVEADGAAREADGDRVEGDGCHGVPF